MRNRLRPATTSVDWWAGYLSTHPGLKVLLISQQHTPYCPDTIMDLDAEGYITVDNVTIPHNLLDMKESGRSPVHILHHHLNIIRETVTLSGAGTMQR